MTDHLSAKNRLVQLFLFALVVLVAGNGCKKNQVPPAIPEVTTIVVQPQDVPIYEEWIGALDGFVNAQITAQVSGYILTQNYKEGSPVKTGDVLFEIDPRPFQAVVDQTLAKLAQDQAQLGKTELDVKRFAPLVKEQAISQEELDNAVQANLAAIAQVKADQAAVENAQLNLGFTKITSPIDGVAGLALAQIGNLVSPSSGLLTTVSKVDPMKAYFSVSEQSYLTFWRNHVSSNDSVMELQMILSDGKTYPQKGRFYFADRQVSQNTGTLQIVGLFPNPDLLLRPGQYARIRGRTSIKTNVFLLPQRAVTELQGSYQIATVQSQNNTNKVHLQSVKIGERVGSNWIVENGLKPNDQVVVEGLQQSKEGTVVNPKPYQSATPPPNNDSPTNQATAQ